MNHPSADDLLRVAYGELPELDTSALEAHIAGCPACRRQLEQLEHGRVALELALRRRGRSAVWAGIALAAAAVLAVVLIGKPSVARRAEDGWRPTTTWSVTAGYVTGGQTMMDIDKQLTRLEGEQDYALPD
jgi:anti-sigma factor ChrR (cupin superfamily)